MDFIIDILTCPTLYFYPKIKHLVVKWLESDGESPEKLYFLLEYKQSGSVQLWLFWQQLQSFLLIFWDIFCSGQNFKEKFQDCSKKVSQLTQGVTVKSMNSKNSIACGWNIFQTWFHQPLPLVKHACGEATGCHAGHEVSRCCIRGESQGMCIMYISAKCE